ncbi:unnamed protein product [Ceutorhynchus assimilis]|uniref:GrpE protein homolog n=1 Tax=Ceutorhynchus assimilis TaxID=467358 RepID=A0A9P0DEA7_9CUCU|nr:unnamed protein product [Ceutorhynchus assimilis]
MALIGVRSILRCGQSISDSLLFNSRSITISKTKFNKTVEESSKSESTEVPPPEIGKGNEEFEKFNKQIAELTDKNLDLVDKYKRALADGENLRQRLTKQISDAKIYGIQGFCKDLLDVADVLGKATETVPKDQITDSNPHLKTLYEGLIMTEAQLKSVFKRHGLEPVNPLDEKFDPNFHEALFQQEVEGKAAGTVVVVSKIGYKLHDRVLRPALVGVSK